MKFQIYVIGDTYVISKSIVSVIGITSQLFYLNWVGQKITDSSEKVFLSA